VAFSFLAEPEARYSLVFDLQVTYFELQCLHFVVGRRDHFKDSKSLSSHPLEQVPPLTAEMINEEVDAMRFRCSRREAQPSPYVMLAAAGRTGQQSSKRHP
jgi:hypothetical protein